MAPYWSHHGDPDGCEDAAAAHGERGRFQLSQGLGGTSVGDRVLDPISTTIVSGVLGRVEDEPFHADWAEARERLGETAASEAIRTSIGS